MTTITAQLNNYRQSPRKVRLLANLIKGKPVPWALVELDLAGKRAAAPMKKLLLSALASAKANQGLSADGLRVKNVTVDVGVILKRSMPRARGSAFKINKRTSHVKLTLEEAKAIKTKAKESKLKKL